jgi:hypothetical protein
MTVWEANEAGYRPYVEWFRNLKHPIKTSYPDIFFHLWLDIWKSGADGKSPNEIIDMLPTLPERNYSERLV